MSNDEDLYFTFELGDNDNIDAEFELEENDNIDCLFEINAAGTVWGKISGTLSDQEDLQAALDTLETEVQNEATTRAENDTLLQGDINTLQNDLTAEINNRETADTTLQGNIDNIQNTINNYGDIVSYNASDFATYAQGQKADSALQPNDNISELNNDAGYITSINQADVIDALGYTPYNVTNPSGYQANVIESIKVNNTTQTVVNKAVNITVPTTAAEVGALPDTTTINDLTTAVQQAALNSGATTTNIGQIATNTSNINSLSNTVTSNYNTLDGRITSEVNTLNGSISNEVTNRQNADNALQTQIDAITSASDVFDIVGTYAELQAYDISTVPVNDIIKVLVDSTHNNAATYYRCVENNDVKSWNYIGAEGAYYTKSEADNKFVEQTITVNGQPLSSNVTLTASDVGALPSSTTIGAGVLTIQKNGTNVDTFSANATANKTINITVPTDTNDLTNGAGFITSNALTGYATETYVDNGLATKQNTLTAGDNITINGDTISAVDTTYTAGTGISIENGVISNTQTSAEWGNIQGDIADQTDLQNILNEKQGKLTAGTDLEILTTPSATITINGTDEISISSVVKGGINSIVADGLASNKSIIPDGYTQYLYVRNGQTTKIDTGFCPTVDDLVFDIKFYSGGTSSMYLWESRDTALLNILGLGGAQNGSTITLYTGSSTSIVSNISRTNGHVYHVIGTLKNGNATLYVKDETDNIEDTVTGTYTFSANSTNMYFFGNETQYLGSGYRIYYAKCWYQGNLAQYWLPATNSEDANGIYNIIDNTFLTGEGNLLVGVEITSPAMDRPMNIVCNNGILRENAQKQVYADGNVETLELRSKNLWSPDNTMSGVGYTVTTTPYGFTCTAQASTGNSSRVIIYCDVSQFKENTTYIIGGIDGYKSVYVGRTVDGVNDTSYYKNGGSGRYFTVTDIAEGQTKILISIYLGAKEQGYVFDFSQIQIEVGNVSTSYTLPYDSQTATVENLYKVYSYADAQNISTGTVTRKTYALTFDGSENWSLAKSGSIYRYNFSLRASGFPDPYTPTSQRGHVITTHFTDIGGTTAQTLGGAFTYSNIYLYVIPSDQTITTVTEFKAWLAQQKAEGTPLIVLYERYTEKTETVTAQSLQPLQRGDSVLSITQSGINNLPLSVNYNKSEINIINFTNDTGYITDSALTNYVTTSTLTTTLTDYVETTTLTSTLTDYVTTSTLTSTLTDYVETTTLATVATSGSYNDLTDKPTIPTVPTNISAFTNDAGYITGINSSDVTTALGYTPYNSTNPDGFITSSALAPYALSSSLATVATSGSYDDLSNKPTIPAAQVNSDWDAVSGVAQILNKPTLGTMASESASDYTKTSGLATVATSGDYDDLTNKPTIPTVNDATITFTQGGTTKGTITLNQSSDATIALDAGGSGTTIPNPAYGTSSTAAATAQKEVSIPEITALNVGQVIMIRPSTTSTVANSTIKLNSFDAYPMRYNNAAITTSTDSTVWGANFISSFMFDGTYWQFIGHGIDSNTTYSNMSVSEGTTGTATSARTMRADYLKQIIQGTKLTGLSTADNSAVVATDSILTGIGKLQAQLNGTVQIDDTTPSSSTVYSSQKTQDLIDALVARIIALEANINGGNA